MAEQVSFRRNMGLFMAVMIGIGATMGPGIFALPGELAHMVGPLGIFVYLVMRFMTVFTALNYSELSVAISLTGGGYSFTVGSRAGAVALVPRFQLPPRQTQHADVGIETERARP
jgi:amino acid transporter